MSDMARFLLRHRSAVSCGSDEVTGATASVSPLAPPDQRPGGP
ncbi:hypothetical protein [Actinomadura soli]|nr:hypothetical protein [Actinomadura soli]